MTLLELFAWETKLKDESGRLHAEARGTGDVPRKKRILLAADAMYAASRSVGEARRLLHDGEVTE